MSNLIRLELDYLKITRKRKRWNLYFIIATEDPNDPTKSLVTATPQSPILVRANDGNELQFEAQGSGDPNGLIVLERPMPADNSVKVRLWVVQSHEKLRNAGNFLEGLTSKLKSAESEAPAILTTVLGSSSAWVSAAKGLLDLTGLVGDVLSDIKDKRKGFLTMDEIFGADEVASGEVDRTGEISSFGEMGWTWIID